TELALLLAQLRRHNHLEDQYLIAAAAASEPRQAEPAQHRLRARLGARLHVDVALSFERGDGDRGSEHRLGRGDLDQGHQVLTLALEAFVLGDPNLHVEVARAAAGLAGVAGAGAADALSALDPRRYLDVPFANRRLAPP